MKTIKRTAKCCDCGCTETANYASVNYRCHDCTERMAGKIRRMADDGMSQSQIGVILGLSTPAVNRWCQNFEIKTPGSEARGRKRVGFGAAPAKLMPSRQALGLVSVWSMAAA